MAILHNRDTRRYDAVWFPTGFFDVPRQDREGKKRKSCKISWKAEDLQTDQDVNVEVHRNYGSGRTIMTITGDVSAKSG